MRNMILKNFNVLECFTKVSVIQAVVFVAVMSIRSTGLSGGVSETLAAVMNTIAVLVCIAVFVYENGYDLSFLKARLIHVGDIVSFVQWGEGGPKRLKGKVVLLAPTRRKDQPENYTLKNDPCVRVQTDSCRVWELSAKDIIELIVNRSPKTGLKDTTCD